MGADLYYALKDKNKSEEAYNWLVNESEINKKLLDTRFSVYITTGEDIEWAKKENPALIDYMVKNHGRGVLKVSGADEDELAEIGCDEDSVYEMWTELFEELNQNFEMVYFAGSCAFRPDGKHYFSHEQMRRITKNGALLSGKSKDPEKYRLLMMSINGITEDSISELYPNMSDKEKSESVHLIRGLIKRREEQITDAISEETKITNLAHYQSPIIIREYANLSKDQEQEIKERGDGSIYNGDRYIGQTIFGVKDNLQPVEDYIKEIKNSSFYKFFVETVSNKAENKYIQTDKVFHDFSAKFKTLEDVEGNTSTEPEKIYKYGMRSRPFDLATYPKNDSFLGADDGETIEGIKYYNIINYSSPLSKDEIANFQLDDLELMAKGGVAWERIIDTVTYLAKKDLNDKYLTNSFYSQIGMSENDFDKLIVKNGYSDAMDFYDEIEEKVLFFRLTDNKKPTKNYDGELYQIVATKDFEVNGIPISKGELGGWVANRNSLEGNSWIGEGISIKSGIKIPENTYLDSECEISNEDDLVVAKTLTKNAQAREKNEKTENGNTMRMG